MSDRTKGIASFADLMKALAQREPCNLQLQASILSPYSITLPPGFALTGKVGRNLSVTGGEVTDRTGFSA
jgi:hypothetical protein